MRYTFNMVTMMKEKVNSHFSFPLRLDMSGYMESNLISSDKLPSKKVKSANECHCFKYVTKGELGRMKIWNISQYHRVVAGNKCVIIFCASADDDEREEEAKETAVEENAGYEYELIGVTVHTGTADGGHYYSFIRDRLNKNDMGQDKWYLFNDAEVKPFDPTQIAMECFGGEMTVCLFHSTLQLRSICLNTNEFIFVVMNDLDNSVIIISLL